jgi:spore germination cell wall hydrolase CwlJ-like protein
MFDNLKDNELMALCIFGEARGEPYAGKCAVGHVILNRVKRKSWYGKTIKGVILKPYQFSCFLKADPNYLKLVELASSPDKIDDECLDIATGVIDGIIDNPVDGATHYHTVNIRPAWKDAMEYVTTIGHHLFYKEA